jgi:hypothetical protein
MGADWTAWCRSRDLKVEADGVRVECGGRQQKVVINDAGDFFELQSVVARRALVQQQEDLAIRAWLRNRGTALVGFRIDHKDRLIAEAWVPKAGLTKAEFQLYVRAVAEESDRFEFQLTGQDVE